MGNPGGAGMGEPDAQVKKCAICGHVMEIEEDAEANPRRHWRCAFGHQEALYGRAEEGEP